MSLHRSGRWQLPRVVAADLRSVKTPRLAFDRPLVSTAAAVVVRQTARSAVVPGYPDSAIAVAQAQALPVAVVEVPAPSVLQQPRPSAVTAAQDWPTESPVPMLPAQAAEAEAATAPVSVPEVRVAVERQAQLPVLEPPTQAAEVAPLRVRQPAATEVQAS